MNLANLTIRVRPDRLDILLPTMNARQLHSQTAALTGLPDDVTSVVLRIFKTNGTQYFDIPVGRRPNGIGIAYAIGTCFPDVGSAKYEIHAYDASGNMTALGEGKITIAAFTTSATPITPGESVPITQIADSSGVMHTIRAVMNDLGEYTTVLDP